MRHYPISSNPGSSFSVDKCATAEGVLVQLTDDEFRIQIRVRLNKEEVDDMIALLQEAKQKAYEN